VRRLDESGCSIAVIAGLDPAIHQEKKRWLRSAMDTRVKPAYDDPTERQHMLNAAIIGLGWWGKELVRSVQRRGKLIRISRGVTLEPELARDFAAEMKFILGTSYQDVLDDPAIDAVILATPHTKHREQVEAAAARGKHVFCEKPFALTRKDAEAAIAACRRAGVALGVGQNRRMWPSIVAIKELIASGRLGTVMFADGEGLCAVDAPHPAVRVRRHHPGAAVVSRRRHRLDRDDLEDAGLRVAPRRLWLRHVGGVTWRNQGDDLRAERRAPDVRSAADQSHRHEHRVLCARRVRRGHLSHR
jgi:hypothetical protein